MKYASWKKWTETAVHRIIISEVHMGYVIYGKTSGSGHLNKKQYNGGVKHKNREDWIKSKGSHEALITESEHAYNPVKWYFA
jgi:site-specific DNA recombinase